MDPIDPLLLQLDESHDSRMDYGVGTSSPENSSHSSAVAGSPLSSTSGAASYQSVLAVPTHNRRLGSPLPPVSEQEAAQTLAPAEFELLNHYLEHTSRRDLTVDNDEQYTLHTGIANLACQSKPLMRSVLAIAAICKCCDIINQPVVTHQDRGQVMDLLSLAEQYHMSSLQDIRASLPESRYYDHILANAAMMGMYGSGSHCIRIWLAKTAVYGDPLSDLMTKNTFQWISLFRAAHLAYVGVLNNTPLMQEMAARQPPSPAGGSAVDHHAMASSSLQTHLEYKISPPRVDQQPAARTAGNHALCPILSATVDTALAKLHENAREIALCHANTQLNGISHYDDSKTPNTHSDPDLQACFTALAILEGIVSEAFHTNNDARASHHHHPGHAPIAFEVDVDPLVGRLSEVSPWLRRYTASITSMIPSRLPRRMIMAFIHKVPTRFLNIIEEMTTHIPHTMTPDGEDLAWDSSSYSTMSKDPPALGQQLAMDIFSHWLVLVIPLDNVWWIGGIGAWELRRFVSFRKQMRWSICVWNKEEDWWPESMYEVSRQFDKHRSRT
ncbi:hypothetical protein B0T17DRAFT_546173 [Bombardia bombarda]|uniref:Uncharacterized protein n=1 Tax=Bombardia bombarda TaxID=252184 RepID=A0AA39TVQ0_9PEZI|nr:hypothetical protein B0T17DRAFT_546173 [Bombardia bombarda]